MEGVLKSQNDEKLARWLFCLLVIWWTPKPDRRHAPKPHNVKMTFWQDLSSCGLYTPFACIVNNQNWRQFTDKCLCWSWSLHILTTRRSQAAYATRWREWFQRWCSFPNLVRSYVWLQPRCFWVSVLALLLRLWVGISALFWPCWTWSFRCMVGIFAQSHTMTVGDVCKLLALCLDSLTFNFEWALLLTSFISGLNSLPCFDPGDGTSNLV